MRWQSVRHRHTHMLRRPTVCAQDVDGLLLWLEGGRHDEGEMLQRFRYSPGGQVSGRPRETRPASTGGTGTTSGSRTGRTSAGGTGRTRGSRSERTRGSRT